MNSYTGKGQGDRLVGNCRMNVGDMASAGELSQDGKNS